MAMSETADSYCSDWYDVEHLEAFYPKLTLGDRLEFKRCLGYCHWAIYSGYEQKGSYLVHKIIHRSVPPDTDVDELASNPLQELLYSKKFGGIQESPLISALPAGDKIRINNSIDATSKPHSPDEIVAQALQLMVDDQQRKYSLAKNNCEHFVNECRYGIHYSQQVVDGCEMAVNKACDFLVENPDTRRKLQGLANTVKHVYQAIKTGNLDTE